jgi:hypothetical protein
MYCRSSCCVRVHSWALTSNKVWARTYHLYKSDYKYQLTRKEITENERINQQFTQERIEENLILHYFAPDYEKNQHNIKTAADVFKEIPEYHTFRYQIKYENIGRILTKLNFPKGQRLRV